MAIIVFDFDGVIAKYDRWKGEDVFGEPIEKTIQMMHYLKDRGDQVLIWTTRKCTSSLLKYLKENNVPYDSINDNSHNPPGTSLKPIFDVFIDDRALNFNKDIDLLKEIDNIINKKGSVINYESK